MNFLGDTNRLAADVKSGKAMIHEMAFDAPGVADGPAELLFRPADVIWHEHGQGIPATITRVIDRPDSRRIVALTVDGHGIEFDTAPEFPFKAGARGFIDVRRPKIYSIAA